jgi:PKD repeat protein
MASIARQVVPVLMIFLLFGGVAGVLAEDVEIKQLLPMFVEGVAYVGDAPAQANLTVKAYINGTFAGEAVTLPGGVVGTPDAPMMVQAGTDESLTGKKVTFQINNVIASNDDVFYQPGTTVTLTIRFRDTGCFTIPIKGGTVFLGEEGLDVSAFLSAGDRIVWFDHESDMYQTEPVHRITVSDPKDFFINPKMTEFGDRTGWWWKEATLEKVFLVKEPALDLRVWNINENEDIEDNDRKVPAGNQITFKIETNLDSLWERVPNPSLCFSNAGIIDIEGYSNVTKVDYMFLKNSALVDIPLRNLHVDNNRWWWPGPTGKYPPPTSWDTGVISPDNRVYPNGEYSFHAAINNSVNHIRDNYRDASGNEYRERTITQNRSMLIVNDYIDVRVDKPEVLRNSSFYVTVTGRKGVDYNITIMECPVDAQGFSNCNEQKMSGAVCDRPPIIDTKQPGVDDGSNKIQFDPVAGPFAIGNGLLYPNPPPDNCNTGNVIRDAVPTQDKPWAKDVIANGTNYYAKISTDNDLEPKPGQRTIKFDVGPDVKPGKYRIHVQSYDSDCKKIVTGDTMVTVRYGEVTLNVKEKAPFYLGDTLTLGGINTDSKFVYLYMTGTQCQNKCGNDLMYIKKEGDDGKGYKILQPFQTQYDYGCKEEIGQFTAIEVPVRDDGSWEYIWQTKNVPINPGTYTIHAASVPINACCVECSCLVVAKMDVTFEEPCFAATITPATITRPIECCPSGCKATSLDAIWIEGQACGFPTDFINNRSLNMWVFGEEKVGNNRYLNSLIPTHSDGTFKVNLLEYAELCDLKPGVYTVILQHPMYNQRLDMVKEDTVRSPVDTGRMWMVTSYPDLWSKFFILDGTGYVQGGKAIEEIQTFDKKHLIDDKFIYLTFTLVDDRVPTAGFTAAPVSGNKPLEVQFTDKSTGQGLSSWVWEFGDKTVDNVNQNPKHTYSEAGVYSVSLTVTNGKGDTDSITKPGYISVKDSLVKADFSATPTSGAAPLKVQFTDKSTGSPNNWFWDFGDGFTAAGVKDPSHTYQYGGKYTVTLSVTLGEEVDRVVKKDYINVIGGVQPTTTPSPINTSQVQLYSGWNFVSVARALADSAANASIVFRTVPTGGHAIWSYDPYYQYWDQVLTNTKIEPLYGYWIYSVSPHVVNLTFKNDPVQAPPQRDLPNGWAAVGFTGTSPSTAKDTFSSVKNSWIYARGFDNARQQWEPTLVNGGQGENTYLYPSKGYWLYMETAGTLAAIGV